MAEGRGVEVPKTLGECEIVSACFSPSGENLIAISDSIKRLLLFEGMKLKRWVVLRREEEYNAVAAAGDLIGLLSPNGPIRLFHSQSLDCLCSIPIQ